MTVYSQNGYVAKDASLIGKYTVPGTKVTVNIRKGDVSVVLLHFMAWFNTAIQPLRQSDTGGYNPRSIAGSNTLSNHASGTAVDLRWDDHPMGKVGTFTKAQFVKIHAQLAFYDGVIRWGGDYTGRKDEMHFEINKAPAAVALIATKCKTGVVHPTGSRTLINDGAPYQDGHDVKWTQSKVGVPTKDQDGKYGPESEKYVKVWQGKNGLLDDGEVGPKTWAKFGIKYTGK